MSTVLSCLLLRFRAAAGLLPGPSRVPALNHMEPSEGSPPPAPATPLFAQRQRQPPGVWLLCWQGVGGRFPETWGRCLSLPSCS